VTEQSAITFTMRQFWGIFNEAIDRVLSMEEWKDLKALAEEYDLKISEGRLCLDHEDLKFLVEMSFLILWREIKKIMKALEERFKGEEVKKG